MALTKCEYVPFSFSVSEALLETATMRSDDLRVLIAKVMCYSVVIFMLIAAFEALVINGIRFVLNMAIGSLNMTHALFSSRVVDGDAPLEILPDAEVEEDEPPFFDEPLPALSSDEESTLNQVCEILASDSWTIARRTPFLIRSRAYTKHLHPLQVMGFMLQRKREHFVRFFSSDALRRTFLMDTLQGFKEPLHAAKTEGYIADFAEKVGIAPDRARQFLLQDPPLIQELVQFVLSRRSS